MERSTSNKTGATPEGRGAHERSGQPKPGATVPAEQQQGGTANGTSVRSGARQGAGRFGSEADLGKVGAGSRETQQQ